MSEKLLAALEGEVPCVAPLCLDPLMARIAARSGFAVGYLSGGALGYAYGVSEALLTLDEVVDATRRITAHVDIDLIVDVGVGFGDAVHVARTVRDLEQVGAAAIELEDQVAPKRVSHHRGIEHLESKQTMVEKIMEAAETRRREDFLIIARTGAIANEGYEHCLDRLAAYRAAGADVLMCMPRNSEQLEGIRQAFATPLASITSMDAAGDDDWRDAGWNLLIDPFTAQVVSVQAIQQAYAGFAEQGHTGVDRKALFATYHDLDALAGLDPYYQIEDRTTEKEART
ncbi:MAG: isocitrate lyase/phosphoenolpyruvate mutase family protein [Pseudomonadota bacterium]